MRVLVTGAAGFVGAHLCDELRANGHRVISTDKQGAVDHPRDLAEPYELENLVEDAKPDYVAHLAARYGRLLCHDEPHRSVADNTASTTELAAVCAERGIPVLYASSSEVYGDHGRETITEQSALLTPTTIYGLSKRWGEEALALYEVKRCVVRMNMLYGPGQLGGYGRCSLATFIDNAVRGEPYFLHPRTTRSWLYISDAVRALRLLIERGNRGVFNLGNPAPAIPMAEVSKLVQEHVATAVEPRAVPVPKGQIAHKNYDTSKLRATIPWEPEVVLSAGIFLTAAWAKHNHEALRAAARFEEFT